MSGYIIRQKGTGLYLTKTGEKNYGWITDVTDGKTDPRIARFTKVRGAVNLCKRIPGYIDLEVCTSDLILIQTVPALTPVQNPLPHWAVISRLERQAEREAEEDAPNIWLIIAVSVILVAITLGIAQEILSS